MTPLRAVPAAVLAALAASQAADHPRSAYRLDEPGAPPPLTAIDRLHGRMHAFHVVADDRSAWIETRLAIGCVDEGRWEGVLVDEAGERIVGVETILSEERFLALPEEERRLWHSHRHAVKSGEIVAPEASRSDEERLIRVLARSYGKAWRTDGVGAPRLLMGSTPDAPIDGTALQERDRRLGLSTAEIVRSRAGIPAPPVAQSADVWRQGTTLQAELREVPVRR